MIFGSLTGSIAAAGAAEGATAGAADSTSFDSDGSSEVGKLSGC